MNDNESLACAISIVANAFMGTLDKRGEPYILHCLAVMDGVKHLGPKAMTAAVLHDLCEDFPCVWSPVKLDNMGFDPEVVKWVYMLTRREGEDYLTYVGRVSTSPVTLEIKLSDLEHNMMPSLISGLSMQNLQAEHLQVI